VISALALGLFGLLQADIASSTAAADIGTPVLVVVALPANANPAIIEALNRLRGEATSVGFEVQLVDAAADPLSLMRLDSLPAQVRPAAVVTFARPEDGTQAPRSLDVSFMDRASGRTSVAHLTTDEIAQATGATDRTDVIIAVRAVDFIRARMFDTLVRRQVEPAPPKPRREIAPSRRTYLAAGLGVLGTPTGFSPSLAPHIAVGYRLTGWLRIGVAGLGFGNEPRRETGNGGVSLDQRFIAASLTLLGRQWHRVQPTFEIGGGEYWVLVRGDATPPMVGSTVTLSSPGATSSLGLALHILPYLALELRGGTLWLQSRARINSTEDTYLGSLGRPTWFGSACVAASF
jgi:hypothetical protein